MLIYFRGGGWSVGGPELYDLVTRKLAHAVGVDYRLAPEYPYPCGLDDCVAAYKWAREYGHNYWGRIQKKSLSLVTRQVEIKLVSPSRTASKPVVNSLLDTSATAPVVMRKASTIPEVH